MKVLLAAHCGFCKGVTDSLRKAREAVQYGKPVYTLGQIVHNEGVCRSLLEEGIGTVDEAGAVRLADATLVVRAHGASRRLLGALHPSVRVVDATCPVVATVRKAVERGLAEGLDLLLAGDPRHDEVRAICEDYPMVQVLADEKAAEAYVPLGNALLVAQTTLADEKWQILADILDKKFKNCDKTLAKNNTICYTTRVRRAESVDLARRVDAMMILGSARSANTCALVELCRKHCNAVYWVESAQDIGKIKQKISTLGVATGASTPLELVTEVITRMSIEEKAVVGEEVEVTVDETAAEVSSAETEEKVEAQAPITTMAQALESMVELKPGAVLTCRVLQVREDGLIVDCGQKKDGFIAAENCGVDDYNPEQFHVDDVFKAKIIENKDKDKSLLSLSKKAVDQEQLAREARAEVEKELSTSKFEVQITKAVKGGLLGTRGEYTIFIPASHVDVKHVEQEELESYVGQTIVVKKLPPKKDEAEREGGSSKRIVASRKVVLLSERRQQAAERKKAREERLAKEEQEKKDIFEANKDRFEVNNIVPGTVKKFVTFGVFVNVYGFDCLCPSSEISWVRHADPATILEQGKEYEFLIIKVDPENYKVTLSYKQIQRQPYELAAEKYPVGTIIKGTVQSLVKFGAFISIEPGVDGLVHISNICDEKIEKPEEVLTVGQEVEAKVISFNDNRIALSIKAVNAPATTQEGGEKPARQPRAKRNFDRPQQERKPRKPEDNLISEEEKQNMEAYNAGSGATNNAFADMLAGFAGTDDTDDDNN